MARVNCAEECTRARLSSEKCTELPRVRPLNHVVGDKEKGAVERGRISGCFLSFRSSECTSILQAEERDKHRSQTPVCSCHNGKATEQRSPPAGALTLLTFCSFLLLSNFFFWEGFSFFLSQTVPALLFFLVFGFCTKTSLGTKSDN